MHDTELARRQPAASRPGEQTLESDVRRKAHASFGGGPTEKGRATGTSLAAYPT
jgi:hypothetical protein